MSVVLDYVVVEEPTSADQEALVVVVKADEAAVPSGYRDQLVATIKDFFGDQPVKVAFKEGGSSGKYEPIYDFVRGDGEDVHLVRAAGFQVEVLEGGGLLVNQRGVSVQLGGEKAEGVDAWLTVEGGGYSGPFYRSGLTVSVEEGGYEVTVANKRLAVLEEAGELPKWAKDVDLLLVNGEVSPYHELVKQAIDLRKREGEKLLLCSEALRKALNLEPSAESGVIKVIKHEGDKWVLYSRDGKKVLGRFGTKAQAVAHEKRIRYFINKDVDYSISKADVEKQYTFGVVYKATTDSKKLELDSHGEYVMEDVLQEAQWSYVQTNDRSIWLQHQTLGPIKLGEWVDIVTLPFEIKAELKLPTGVTKKTKIPANSIWMGVLWNDAGWKLVKAGKIRGLSLGGMARRRRVG